VAEIEPVVDVAGDAVCGAQGLAHVMEQSGVRLLRFLGGEGALLDLRSEGLAKRPQGQPLELSVVLTDDEGIRALNLKWRQIDSATDVLSFPLESGPFLGDVVISVETARGRVNESWDVEDELIFLLIHGLLHLLGHDHEVDQERIVMEAGEQSMWTALGRTGTLRTPGVGAS